MDVSLVSKETRGDFLDGVVSCWQAYPLALVVSHLLRHFVCGMVKVEIIAENTENQDNSAAPRADNSFKRNMKICTIRA